MFITTTTTTTAALGNDSLPTMVEAAAAKVLNVEEAFKQCLGARLGTDAVADMNLTMLLPGARRRLQVRVFLYFYFFPLLCFCCVCACFKMCEFGRRGVQVMFGARLGTDTVADMDLTTLLPGARGRLQACVFLYLLLFPLLF